MLLLHFHLFGALPLELRCEIWTLSLPSPRSILPFRDDEFTQYERHPVIENPIALRVCQESRVVAIRYYRTWTNAEALGYQYVDFTNDSIIFESEAFDLPGLEMRHMNRINMSTLLLPKIDRERIEKVELRVFGPDAHQRGGIGSLLSHWAEHCMMKVFPSVKEVDVSVYLARHNSAPWVLSMPRQALIREVRWAGDEIWNGMNKVIEKNMEMRADWLVPDVSIRIMIETSSDDAWEYLHQPGVLSARDVNERLRQQAVLRGDDFYIPSY